MSRLPTRPEFSDFVTHLRSQTGCHIAFDHVLSSIGRLSDQLAAMATVPGIDMHTQYGVSDSGANSRDSLSLGKLLAESRSLTEQMTELLQGTQAVKDPQGVITKYMNHATDAQEVLQQVAEAHSQPEIREAQIRAERLDLCAVMLHAMAEAHEAGHKAALSHTGRIAPRGERSTPNTGRVK